MEIGVGLFVAIGLAALFMLTMRVSNLSTVESSGGYVLYAHFQNIGGLKVRSPVTMSGVRIGRVTSIEYDPQSFDARVEMTIAPEYDFLPRDSQASIYTAGLLGEQYLALEPGGDIATLGEGDRVQFTQSALVLEEIVGRVLVNLTGGE
jgi:phospholipid/cholesterol/gamma-HCH transport system substrate-binding protein